MSCQLPPPSSDRQRTPSLDWMRAYTRRGWFVATAMPMRPVSPTGSPWPVSFVHVIPLSVDRYRPPSGPPLSIVHGKRRYCHTPAKTTLGWNGSHARSDTPLRGPTYSVFVHVWPPSIVRKTPRASLSLNGSPSAPTSAIVGVFGSTRILEICEVLSSPRWRNVFPPSMESHTPSPHDTSLRGFGSPVPTHTKFLFDGAMAIAPIALTGSDSSTAFHVVPASVERQMPPPAAPA